MLRVAKVLTHTEANGPGVRTAIWFQGCTLGCLGCVNKWSWPSGGGAVTSVEQLVDMVAPDVQGISLTGGEPFQQAPRALVEFLGQVSWRGRGDKSVLVFTGYTLGELSRMADENDDYLRALHMVDILVAGRYIKAQRVQNIPLIGSSNQRVHFLTDRYSRVDLGSVVATEIHIDMDTGESASTGVTQ